MNTPNLTNTLVSAVTIASVFAAQVAFAQTASTPWLTGSAELGYVSTTGNSQSSNINAKVALAKDTKNWSHSIKLAGIGSSSEASNNGVVSGQRSVEKYNFDYQTDRNLDEVKSLYVFSNYEKDRFSGFDQQTAFGVGYGHKVILKPDQQMQIDVGPAYRINNPIQGSTQSETVLHLGENYFWNFSETAKFEKFFVIDTGSDNTISKLGFAVTANLTGTLGLKLASEWKLTDNPGFNAAGVEFEDLDSVTTINITYGF